MALLLPIGTRKGLFLLRSGDGKTWDVEGPLPESEVRVVGAVAGG